MHDKVLSQKDFLAAARERKTGGKKIVHCHGVFDLVHPGHLRHFKEAKTQGDALFVSLTADRFVNKGPGRPVFQESLRAEFLAALECIDFVTINDAPTAVELIRVLKPDVYVKGSDYERRDEDLTGKIHDEEAEVLAGGGRIHFTHDIVFSSSQLINNHFGVFPPEVTTWLKGFRQKYSSSEVLACLDEVSKLKVVIVGESILDDYVFCQGLGKSSKDPILAFLYLSSEMYAGGSLAVANHLAGFCDSVELVTLLGDRDRQEDFVRRSLRPQVRPHLLTQTGAPTIQKRRFVDQHTLARMFELYTMEDGPVSDADEERVINRLNEVLPSADVVIVTDYGHGMLTPAVVDTLCTKSKFLCINTQANAGNRGFNTISKYPRADYVCQAGHEIALETRMKHVTQKVLLKEAAKRLDCPLFTVTLGRDGTLHYTRSEDSFVEVPALATKVSDRVGAGDAVLALTSLLVYLKKPWDVVGFLANIAGAQMVADLGNRASISKVSIGKSVLSLMQ